MSCKYCDTTSVDKEHSCSEYYIHHPFVLKNEHTNKRIKNDGNNPVCYYREYYKPKTHLWHLVMEFADDKGTVVEMPAHYCINCGDKLVGKDSFKESANG